MMEHGTVAFFVLMAFIFGNLSGMYAYHALVGVGL